MLMRERSCAGVVWCEGFNETRSVRVGSYGPSSLYRSAHEHAHACASPHLTSHLHLWLKGAHKASLSVQPHLTSPRLHPVPLCAHSNVRHFAVLRSLKKKKKSFERFTFHASLLATVSRSAARTARRRYKLRDFAAALELYDQASRLDPLNMVYELNKGAVRLEAEQ
jgi:hypothetical protein